MTVGKDDVLEPFGAASGMAAKKHHIEAFKWVHFVSEEGLDDGYFESTNSQSAIRVPLRGHDSTAAIDVFLPTRLFNVLKAMPAGPVQLEFTGNTKVSVHGTSEHDAKFDLALYVPTEEVPKVGTGSDLEWEGKPEVSPGMIEAMGVAAKFASTDQSRPSLLSVIVAQEDDGTIIAATDSYRMYVAKRQEKVDIGEGGAFPIPRDAVGAMSRIDTPRIDWDGNKVYLTDGAGVFFSTQKVHGDAPPVSDMVSRIMDQEGTDFKVPRGDMLGALNQVSVLATPQSSTVTLTFGGLTIDVRLVSDSDVAQAGVLCDGQPEGEVAGYNVAFLRDGLNLFAQDSLNWHYINPLKPLVMTSDDGDLTYMIAAVKVT